MNNTQKNPPLEQNLRIMTNSMNMQMYAQEDQFSTSKIGHTMNMMMRYFTVFVTNSLQHHSTP